MSSRAEMLKEQMRAMIAQMVEMDISTIPALATMVALRGALIDKGMEVAVAETIVASMKCEVNQNFIEDKEFMTEFLDGYATFMMAVYAELRTKFDSPEAALKSMAKDMSITFTA